MDNPLRKRPAASGLPMVLATAAALVVPMLPAPAWAAEAAEFAIRWDPAAGGPKSLDEVLAILKVQDPKKKSFKVRYLSVQSALKVPAGYSVIGRERTNEGKTEATYKIRGPLPLPGELANWACPLKDGESKREVDVSFTGRSSLKRSMSLSCSVDESSLAPLLPPGYAAKPMACTSVMERRKKGGLTIEKWTLATGRVVFEVSLKGDDTPEAFKAFNDQVVAPLLEKQVTPMNESKTELGSKC